MKHNRKVGTWETAARRPTTPMSCPVRKIALAPRRTTLMRARSMRPGRAGGPQSAAAAQTRPAFRASPTPPPAPLRAQPARPRIAMSSSASSFFGSTDRVFEKPSLLFQMQDLSAEVQTHLIRVYRALLTGVLAIAAGVALQMYTGIGGTFFSLASIGVLFYMQMGHVRLGRAATDPRSLSAPARSGGGPRRAAPRTRSRDE